MSSFFNIYAMSFVIETFVFCFILSRNLWEGCLLISASTRHSSALIGRLVFMAMASPVLCWRSSLFSSFLLIHGLFERVWQTRIRVGAEFSLVLVAFVLLVSWQQPAERVVLFWAGVDGLTLAWSIPLQNQCIDGERGGWSLCESCWSALGFLAAAAA